MNREPTQEELDEIASLVTQGYTSGRLDGEDGRFVAWNLNTEVWKNK